MITDINSLVSGQGKTSTAPTTSTANLGALAKLSSELKLIDGLHPIQITSVKNAQTTSGNQQLIGITRSDQQQYTLVNNKPSPNLQAGDKGTLNVSGNQASLTVFNQRPAQTTNVVTQPQIPSPAANPTSSASSSTAMPASSVAGQQNLTNATQNTSMTSNPAPVSPQQAQTIAQVAIASRPIILTVIGSNTPQPKTTTTPSPQSQTSSTNSNISTSRPTPPSNAQATNSAAVPAPASTTPAVNKTTINPTLITQVSPQETRSPLPQTANTGANATFSAVVTDGNEQFTLNTQHPLKVGETLTVMVDKQGQLQLYPTERPSPTATTLTEGLKQTLPKQISPQEFVSMIRQLNHLAQSGTALPEKVAVALEQLVKQLPNLQSLTQSSDGIKQAIQNSGLFSEHNLSQKTNLTSDLKLNLSRLEGANLEISKQANTTGPQATHSQQAMSLVAGAIERITTSQVRHLIENAQQDGSILPLSIEIPIKDGQSTSVVNLRIDKDASDKDKEVEPHKRRWLVQLKFDFEETGRFEARASIQDKKVGILFAVEAPTTEQMIRQRLDELRDNLRSKQVEVETLDCFRAKLNDKPNQYQEPTQQRLIDVRT